MQLHEAFELKEIYSLEQANRALQVGGWQLLAVISGANGIIYVMGKKKLKQAPEQGQDGFQTQVYS